MRARMVVKIGDEQALERGRIERNAVTKRLWWLKNLAKRSEYWKSWRERNKEREAARKKAWREANREEINVYNRRYYELNPKLREYRASKNREYRARKKQRDYQNLQGH